MDDKVPVKAKFAADGRDDMAQMEKVLSPGKIYVGEVIEVHYPSATCTVAIDNSDTRISGCVWTAGILSGLLGFKTSYLPPTQTRVLILFTGQPPYYMIGAAPGPLTDVASPARPTVDGEESYHNAQYFHTRGSSEAIAQGSQKPPIDLTEGEFQIDNLLGVGLTLLRHLAKLQAGDLASVECHLMDDMVRIVSDTFKHYTAFGNQTIVNDGGKLNVEWHGTSHDFEAWGLKKASDPKATFSGENRLDPSADTEGFLDDGRWRFSQYVGWLGDFIHMFVTDPVEGLGRIASDSIRAGKARLHVANDGAILVQSVADIALEKVVRIPVPVRLRPQGDPAGETANEAPKTFDPLKNWKPSSSGNLFEMVFQLREYARWLNNQAAFARFRMSPKEFRVPSEAETPAPKINNAETDREEANGTATNWQIAYSTIRIFRDGSIQTMDAYGNSFTSTKTGIQISSTADILLEAAGSVNVVAGNEFNVVAQNNIGLSAIKGGLWLRAQTGIQMLAALGNVIIDTLGIGILKIIGGLNVNNLASIDLTGSVNALGSVTATQVAASSTSGPYGDQPHMFHLHQGVPVVVPNIEFFLHPTSYSGADLYQSLSQQALEAGEASSSGDWSFTENLHPLAGSPWPGIGATHKVASGGDSLQEPSSKTTFTTSPSSLQAQPITVKYVS